MKEKTKRKVFGKRLYAIYRRARYLRFMNKLKKERKRQLKLELKEENEQIKSNLKAYNTSDRRKEKQLRAARKQQEKAEQKVLRETIRAKEKEEKKLAKIKTKQEKKEAISIRNELRVNLKANSLREKQERKELKLKQKIELKEYKLRKKQIKPYLRKRRRRELIRSIRNIDRQTVLRWLNWFKELWENRIERLNFLKITLNSTSLFVLSYLFLIVVGQAIITLIAYTYKYKTILFYFKIYYDIDSAEWTGDAVKILYSIQPLTGIIFGLIALIMFNSKRDFHGVFKLFYLWVFINGMVMFFGSLLIGTLLNQGFGWVISYLYYRDTGKMVFSIISIFALASLGAAIARSFLISGNTYFNFIDNNNRKFLLMSQVMFPAIFGSMIIAILKFPPEYYYTTSEEVTYEILKLSTFILIILPIFLSFSSFTDTFFDEEPRRIRIKFLYILIAAAIICLLMFGLSGGIEINPPEVL